MSGTAGCIPLLIAQVTDRDAPKGDASELHVLLLILVAVAVVMGIFGYLLIRKFRPEETPEDETPFTLSQLRRIFEAGEISLEEFEHMRETMIAKVKATLAEDEIAVDGSGQAGVAASKQSESAEVHPATDSPSNQAPETKINDVSDEQANDDNESPGDDHDGENDDEEDKRVP